MSTYIRTLFLLSAMGSFALGCEDAPRIDLPPTGLVPDGGTPPVLLPDAGSEEDADVEPPDHDAAPGSDADIEIRPFEPTPPSEKPNADLRRQLLEGDELRFRLLTALHAELPATLDTLAAEGYVVTTAVTEGGRVRLFAYRAGDGAYTARFDKSNAAGLSRQVDAMTRDGFLITAMTRAAYGYGLIGWKPSAYRATFHGDVAVVDPEDADEAVARFGTAGFVVTAAAPAPDGRLALIANQPVGTDRLWDTRVEITDTTRVVDVAIDMAQRGYAVTEAIDDGHITLIGFRAPFAEPLAIQTETVPSDLAAAKGTDWSTDAVPVLAVISDGTLDTLLGYAGL